MYFSIWRNELTKRSHFYTTTYADEYLVVHIPFHDRASLSESCEVLTLFTSLRTGRWRMIFESKINDFESALMHEIVSLLYLVYSISATEHLSVWSSVTCERSAGLSPHVDRVRGASTRSCQAPLAPKVRLDGYVTLGMLSVQRCSAASDRTSLLTFQQWR